MFQSFVEKFKEPILGTHLANFIFSLSVLVALSKTRVEGDGGKDLCAFDTEESICRFSSLVSLLSLLFSIGFLVVEAQWERLGSFHRWIYLVEMIWSLFWAISFFGTFLLMVTHNTANSSFPSVNFALVFCFFAVLSWLVLAYFSFRGYREDDLSHDPSLGVYQNPNDFNESGAEYSGDMTLV